MWCKCVCMPHVRWWSGPLDFDWSLFFRLSSVIARLARLLRAMPELVIIVKAQCPLLPLAKPRTHKIQWRLQWRLEWRLQWSHTRFHQTTKSIRINKWTKHLPTSFLCIKKTCRGMATPLFCIPRGFGRTIPSKQHYNVHGFVVRFFL